MKTTLNWMQKFHLFASVDGWTPTLEPPDPDYEAQLRAENLEVARKRGELEVAAYRRSKREDEWTFHVRGLAIYEPGRGIFGQEIMTVAASGPAEVVEGMWDMLMEESAEGKVLCQYDPDDDSDDEVLGEDRPRIDECSFYRFDRQDNRFVSVDPPGVKFVETRTIDNANGGDFIVGGFCIPDLPPMPKSPGLGLDILFGGDIATDLMKATAAWTGGDSSEIGVSSHRPRDFYLILHDLEEVGKRSNWCECSGWTDEQVRECVVVNKVPVSSLFEVSTGSVLRSVFLLHWWNKDRPQQDAFFTEGAPVTLLKEILRDYPATLSRPCDQ